MIDAQMIKRKIEKIQEEIVYLEEFKKLSFDDVAKDMTIHRAIERTIEIIVGNAIDTNQHIIAKSKNKHFPFDFKESFLLLSDFEIYPKEFGEKISKSAGLEIF